MFALVVPDTLVLVGVPIVAAIMGWLIRTNVKLTQDNVAVVKDEHVEEAKDELIETLQANHSALADRVGIMETHAHGLVAKLDAANKREADLVEKLEDAVTRYDEMKQYTAPEAVRQFTGMLDTHSFALNSLLQQLLGRLTDIENWAQAIHENTEAVHEKVLADRALVEAPYQSVANRRREDEGPPAGEERRGKGRS